MKISIKIVLCLICLLVFSFLETKGQEIIVHKKDTMVAISKSNLRTLNCIIIDFENTKDQLEIYKRIVLQDSLLLCNKDSVISLQNEISSKKDEYYKNNILILKDEIKKEKKKKKIWTSILGGVAIIFGILSIK